MCPNNNETIKQNKTGKESNLSSQNQYEEISTVLFEIVRVLVYRIQMQALQWNFLKQGTTHKAGFEGHV